MAYYNSDRQNGMLDSDVQLIRDMFRLIPGERYDDLRQRVALLIDARIAAGRELAAERAKKVM